MARESRFASTSLAYLVSCLCLSSCFGADEPSGPTVLDEPPPETVAGHTSGVVSSDSVIRVTFTGDIVGISEVNSPLSTSPFKVDPPIKGDARFSSPNELQLRPDEPLRAGQRYKVHVDPSKIQSAVRRVPAFSFFFEVVPQSFTVVLDGLSPSDDDGFHGQKLTGTIFTADVASPADVEAMLAAKHGDDALTIEWRHELPERRHAFTIAGIGRKEAQSSVGLVLHGAPISVDRREHLNVPVPGLDQFVLSHVRPVTVDTHHVEARFSDPLNPNQDLTGLVHTPAPTEPSTEAAMRFVVDGSILRIYRRDSWPREATVVFEPGIQNAAGHRLMERASHTVSFSPLLPAVRFTSKGTILPTTGDLTLPIETANLGALDVQAIRVSSDNITQFLQVNPLDGNREMRRVGQVVWSDTVELVPPAGSQTRWMRHGLDISRLLEEDPAGLYQIRLTFRPQHSLFECPRGTFRGDFLDRGLQEEILDEPEQSYWDHHETNLADSIWAIEAQPWEMWRERKNPCHPGYYRRHQDHDISVTRNVLVTNVGLVVKTGTDGSIFVAATDLRTALPRAGAEIRVLDFQRQELATGWTKLDGTVTLKTSRQPYFILAKHEGAMGIVRLEPGRALAVGHLDVGGLQVSKGLKGLIYGERGVWRPGDDIYLTFVLHDPEGRVPENHPARFELVSSRGQTVHQATYTSSVNGFYPLRARTSPSAATGNYIARVEVGGATFEEVVKIETVMPNRLKIDLDMAEPGPILGQSPRLATTLRSAWLHGAPARRLKVDMEMTLRPVTTRFDRWEGFTFDDPTRQFRPTSKTLFQGLLTDEGEATIDAPFETGTPPGMLTAHLATRVFEPGGASSMDHFSVPVSPYERYVGVRTPQGDRSRGMLLTDEKHEARIVVVDPDGNPVADAEVEVALYKIQWRWWWESGPEELPDFTASTAHSPIHRGTVPLRDGEGKFEFEVRYPDWGRYLLLVQDREGGHRSGRIVYIDWPGWAGRAMDDQPFAASVLAVTADAESYEPGATATLAIPTPQRGRVLVTLEDGTRVLSAKWIEATGDTTRHSFPVEPGMAPGVYAHVSLVQPHQHRGNDLPMRLYGVVPLRVEDPRTRLSPVIATNDVFEPQSRAEISVSESSGRPMTYTLAVVDEGLLGLTRFATPDPWSRFYQREALGVTTWDVYDDVAGAHGGAFDRLVAIGGDEEGSGQESTTTANRFPPMVRFAGPFELEARQTKTHSIDIPQYVGAVRVMVVAGEDGAFGKADKTVLVKKPLMLLATLPRVLGPGEEVELPVSVFSLDEGAREVTLEVEASSGLRLIDGARRNLTFTAPGDQMATLRVKVAESLGVERVRVTATSGRERAEQEIEIEVRHPGTRELRVVSSTIEPGATWTPGITFTGLLGTNRASLEVSRMQPMDLGAHLDYLIGYPHGCLEQVMSQAFPQLHLSRLMNLGAERQAEITRNVQAAIATVASHQTEGGGFGYWSTDSRPHDWTSSYVGHFLLEAQQTGHPVPTGLLHRWEGYQRRVAQAFLPSSADRADLAQAYRLYTLALAGKPELGAMNRLREWSKLSAPARWRLAAAYQLAGQTEAARRLVQGLGAEVSAYQELGGTFGSALRDQAMILETAVLIGDSDRVIDLSREISSSLSQRRSFNTQELGFALVAMARALERFGEPGSMTFAYDWAGGRSTVTEDKPIHLVDLPVKGGEPSLAITNNGSAPLFSRLFLTGLPEVGQETAAERGLRMSVSYVDTEGTELSPDRLEQGMDFVTKVTVSNTRHQPLSELALTHIVPSGWEIRGERLSTAPAGGSTSPFDHRDVRDDRVHTYFGLDRGQSKTFEIRLHSAYPGRFYLPGISVEAMYDSSIHGRTSGGWVEVTRPGLTG